MRKINELHMWVHALVWCVIWGLMVHFDKMAPDAAVSLGLTVIAFATCQSIFNAEA